MCTILGWDFLRIKRSSHRSATLGALRSLFNVTTVDISEKQWKEAVIAKPLLEWCLAALCGPVGVLPPGSQHGMAVALRHFFVLISSVSGVGLRGPECEARGSFCVHGLIAVSPLLAFVMLVSDCNYMLMPVHALERHLLHLLQSLGMLT
jgi:hypothetical protein